MWLFLNSFTMFSKIFVILSTVTVQLSEEDFQFRPPWSSAGSDVAMETGSDLARVRGQHGRQEEDVWDGHALLCLSGTTESRRYSATEKSAVNTSYIVH